MDGEPDKSESGSALTHYNTGRGGKGPDTSFDFMQTLNELTADDLGTGKLPLIDPMSWKNVGIHMQSSIKILKE
jgi:hypothetical protein